ncbi:MAG: GatB/YqeY domain-containing protein [Oscillospiraceae bacterium]|nr:GatB/YqeY domain-containing protein [Oscillospiraceae bacterium]
MALKERLAEDLKSAMKDKNIVRKNTVQMIRAGILQVEKDNKVTLEDDGIIDVIAKQLKQRKDVLPDYEKSGRDDLIAELKAEMDVLMEYLPKQLTAEEIEEAVAEAIKSTSASSMKDMGRIMAEVMPKVKGRADGRMINEAAKKLLSQC